MTDSIYPSATREITAWHTQRRSLIAGFEPNARTLAGKHALVLRDVRRRTTPVLVLIETRIWPEAELRTLIRFLRNVVLSSADLTMDHVRLESLIEHLDQVAAHPCVPELTVLIEELLATLEWHLAADEAAFGALPRMPGEVPGAAEVAAGTSG